MWKRRKVANGVRAFARLLLHVVFRLHLLAKVLEEGIDIRGLQLLVSLDLCEILLSTQPDFQGFIRG